MKKKKYMVTYNSNNSGGSGGSWWLSEDNWKALEANGWKLFSYGDFIYDESGNYKYDENGLPERKWKSPSPDLFGAYATYGFKRFDTPKEALEEFERLTKKDISEEGCNCCGPPHNFSWDDGEGSRDYCSGEGCLSILFPNKQVKSVREYLEDEEC